jgi:proteasome lid subunit RPN8/RPN11
MRLRLSGTVPGEIRDHGASEYPHECCGAMLGERTETEKTVTRVVRIENARVDGRRNRFLITGQDYVRVEQEAAARGLDLVGFYHSHPDHPARPSQHDLDHALPWFSYVIVAVAGGAPRELTSWILAEDRSRFLEETVLSERDGGGASRSSERRAGSEWR